MIWASDLDAQRACGEAGLTMTAGPQVRRSGAQDGKDIEAEERLGHVLEFAGMNSSLAEVQGGRDG